MGNGATARRRLRPTSGIIARQRRGRCPNPGAPCGYGGRLHCGKRGAIRPSPARLDCAALKAVLQKRPGQPAASRVIRHCGNQRPLAWRPCPARFSHAGAPPPGRFALANSFGSSVCGWIGTQGLFPQARQVLRAGKRAAPAGQDALFAATSRLGYVCGHMASGWLLQACGLFWPQALDSRPAPRRAPWHIRKGSWPLLRLSARVQAACASPCVCSPAAKAREFRRALIKTRKVQPCLRRFFFSASLRSAPSLCSSSPPAALRRLRQPGRVLRQEMRPAACSQGRGEPLYLDWLRLAGRSKMARRDRPT